MRREAINRQPQIEVFRRKSPAPAAQSNALSLGDAYSARSCCVIGKCRLTPFGGTGSAGMGHYYGKYGFDALTHAKSMLISPPDVAIDHLYSPFTDEKNRALQGWFEY